MKKVAKVDKRSELEKKKREDEERLNRQKAEKERIREQKAKEKEERAKQVKVCNKLTLKYFRQQIFDNKRQWE